MIKCEECEKIHGVCPKHFDLLVDELNARAQSEGRTVVSIVQDSNRGFKNPSERSKKKQKDINQMGFDL